MIKLARPICPNSQIEMEWRDGKYQRKDANPLQQNCQLAGGKWWEHCETLKHNPYVTTHTWTTTEPAFEGELDAEGKPTGRMIKTGDTTILHSSETPNFAQVAISIRINSGLGAEKAMRDKGYKRLKDVGYAEVCQFRNCQKPISDRAKSRKYGDYCSPEHLQLVAADQQGIMLHLVGTGLEGPLHERVADKREKQLREAAAFAVD
jgi:hypothetical protein